MTSNSSVHPIAARAFLAISLALLFCVQSPVAVGAERAKNDQASTTKGTRVKVNVTKNDTGFNKKNYKVKIIKRPKRGKATVGKDRRITYAPKSKFVGRDTLVYRLTDNRGFSRKATLTITVKNGSKNVSRGGSGGNSGSNRRVKLRWNPSPVKVDGYVVLFGTRKSNVVVKVADISVKRGTLDRNAPNVVLYAGRDLGVGNGDNACFRVRAYRGGTTSALSSPICKIVR